MFKHTNHSRTVRIGEAVNRRTNPTIRGALVLVVLVAVAALAVFAARAEAYPPLAPGVVKVDTGDRQEDQQPRWTARLARAGWDYNPSCDQQGERFDWFAPGQPCNERPVLVSGVGTAQIVGVL